MNRELDLPAISGKEQWILHFMVFFSSSCTSRGKSCSHDVWYFRSCLLFPVKTSGWDSAFLLSPGSFVEFNCFVAWMPSLLVTASSDFLVKPKRNKLMVAHKPAIFVCLVSLWQVRERTGHKLAREEKHGRKRNTRCIGVRTRHCTCFSFFFYVHVTKILEKGFRWFCCSCWILFLSQWLECYP